MLKVQHLILFALFLLAFRPVIDLAGHYEGGVINLGGAVGLVFGLTVMFTAIWRAAKISRDRVRLVIFFTVIISFIFSLISFIGSPKLEASLPEWARYFVGFSSAVLFILMLTFDIDKKYLTRIFWVLISASLMPFIIQLLQAAGYYDFSYYDYIRGERLGRPTGGYHQPNSLGRLMVFVIVAAYIFALSNNIRWVVARAIVLIAVFSIFMTTHRTSLISAIFVIFIIESYFLAQLNLRNIFAIIISGFAIIFGVSLFSISGPDYLKVYFSLDDWIWRFETLFVGLDDGRFLRGRGRIWNESISIIQSSGVWTLAFGAGYGKLEAHNDALFRVMVFGFLGLVMAYLVIILSAFHAWHLCNKGGRHIVVAVMAFFLAFSIPLHPTGYPFFMWLFFGLLGMNVLLNGRNVNSRLTQTAKARV